MRWAVSTAGVPQYEITIQSTEHVLHTRTGARDQTEHIHKQEYKIKQNATSYTVKKYSILKF
jgi:hypothetical protein